MSFEVPAHVRPIRDRVRRFIEDKIYPVESILDRRGDADAGGRSYLAPGEPLSLGSRTKARFEP